MAGGYFAAPGPAAAWNVVAAEIKAKEGVVIRVNGPDSAYRTWGRQVYYRSYWCGLGHCENAAEPGTSNHGLGWAFDVPDYVGALLDKYGAKYGFRRACSDAPWENWHWHWCGGWTGKDPGADGQAAPKYPTLKKGSKNSAATKRAQKHLRRWNLGLTRPQVDGDFGATTQKAVEEFQTVHYQKPDGVIGPKTWKLLRAKDHFLDDERFRINKVRYLRATESVKARAKVVRRNRDFCAARAKSIQTVSQTHGWGGQHRKERFDLLRKLAGNRFK